MIAELVVYGSFVAVAWCGHTPRSRQRAEQLGDALTETRTNLKAAGIEMGLGDDCTKISRQLSGKDALNLWRLAALSDAFWIAFAKRILGAFGYVVIAPQEREVLLAAAHLGRKRMAQIAPDIFDQKKAV